MSVREREFSDGQVRAEVTERIGQLRLSRPERSNALSVATLEGVIQAAAWLGEVADVRVVVVSGEGRNFSAGADFASFTEIAPEKRGWAADLGRRAAESIEGLDAITIASIRGWCVGGALVLAAACDLRMATDSARFSIPEVELGIPLAWGGVPRLVREVGAARAKELILTCRPFDAREACSLGLLNRVVPNDDLDRVVAEWAATIAAKPSFAVRATKSQVSAASEALVSTRDAWRDADGLVAALQDPEGKQARNAYIAATKR